MYRAQRFLALCIAFLLAGTALAQNKTRQATGVKVGEVTENSAIVWMRVTANAARNTEGQSFKGRPAKDNPKIEDVDKLEGAVPGAPGQVRLRYGTKQDLADARSTEWTTVKTENDFSHQFKLTALQPGTTYYYEAQTRGPKGEEHDSLKGRFQTAPKADAAADVTFTVVTGQAYKDIDHDDGFHIYEGMGKLNPQFIVPTGDTVYYDSEAPRAVTPALARYHWQRMYGFPRHIDFHLKSAGYWEKDDHDTVANDCWPTMKPAFMLPLTFETGCNLFREQVPMGDKTYRTFRWGKDLQVWLVEGRDFRSPNNMKDGPMKTIWGEEQKKWLKDTMLKSDATWKVLVSPTPIVGPDRAQGKNDNHSNKAFETEGNEVRKWFAEKLPDNFFICCGDRHWQYYSIDPETKVKEFSCGPASDKHAGGSPGQDKEFHQFHRVKGGFLSVSVNKAGNIFFRFHDVMGNVVHEYKQEKK
ncbi:MAG: alkaline phosphatase [Gemmataceae bacterium]